jgi:hypothetical protein
MKVSEDDFFELAVGDLVWLVVAPEDLSEDLSARGFHSLRREERMCQEVNEDVGGILQMVPENKEMDGSKVVIGSDFHGGADVVQRGVQGVAREAATAARAERFGEDVAETDTVGRLVAIAPREANIQIHDRELAVRDDEEARSVVQEREINGRRRDGTERWIAEGFPALHLA